MFKSKLSRAAIVLVVMGVVFGWEYGIKASIEKSKEWQGTVKETYQKRRVRKMFLRPFPSHHKYYDQYYNHYWRVECSDGNTLSVKVPYDLWSRARAGDPVRKVRGERWPFIDTPEEAQRRETQQKAIDMIVDGITKKITGTQ